MSNPGPSSIGNYSFLMEHAHLGMEAGEKPIDDDVPDPEGFRRFIELPELSLEKVFKKLPVSDLKNCRLTCTRWNVVITESDLLDRKSCFLFDGRRDDSEGGRCAGYMENSANSYYWSHMKFRRVAGRQMTGLLRHLETDSFLTDTVFKLELLNCSLNWTIILQTLMRLPNLYMFVDKQDMYCWDYQTFNTGIDENEEIRNNSSFRLLQNPENLSNLGKIKVIHVHRSQLVECTTYIKMFAITCENLLELEITTDQNFAPQRAISFYTNLEGLLQKNKNSLITLRFPYRLVCPTYDFRILDEHHCFREFMNFISDRRWSETLGMTALENLQLQFGNIPVDNQDLKTKLVPFLNSIPTLRSFQIGCTLLESGVERFVDEYLRETQHSSFKTQFGIYMNDATGPVEILHLQSNLSSLSLQTFRDMSRQVKDLVPMLGVDLYEDLEEFQYFSKNHSFKNFNMDLLTESFCNLTRLNLVDHNSRLDNRHSCEALALIEDEDMQLIINKLIKLESLQLITNMTYLTDSGMTGISLDCCKSMQQLSIFQLQNTDDVVGKPFSSLQNLKYLVLRGLGIKVTDVTAYFAFNSLGFIRKLHIYGCHQITAAGKSLMSQRFNATNGCDLQIATI